MENTESRNSENFKQDKRSKIDNHFKITKYQKVNLKRDETKRLSFKEQQLECLLTPQQKLYNSENRISAKCCGGVQCKMQGRKYKTLFQMKILR